jgi:lipopolysaccharide/colanic/teichoic acid biosynthesis glycosyltransferase
MLSIKQKRIKRCVDLLLSSIGIVIFTVPIFILVIISTIVHQEFGVFFQKRVGKNAKVFTIYKIKSMIFKKEPLITSFGNFIRKTKLDELLQVFNVFFGQMSIVGPRPDILGYADKLKGEDKIILSVKPGLTSLAALKFANEELLLKSQNNPLVYNDLVLWPQKVALNKQYITNWSLFNDFKVIGKTILFFLGFNQTPH